MTKTSIAGAAAKGLVRAIIAVTLAAAWMAPSSTSACETFGVVGPCDGYEYTCVCVLNQSGGYTTCIPATDCGGYCYGEGDCH